MIREILSLMIKGRMGLKELEEELGLTEDQLLHGLREMERMGYIEVGDPAEFQCGKKGYCLGCPYARSGKKKDCSRTEAKSYYLTEKGRRMVRG